MLICEWPQRGQRVGVEITWKRRRDRGPWAAT